MQARGENGEGDLSADVADRVVLVARLAAPCVHYKHQQPSRKGVSEGNVQISQTPATQPTLATFMSALQSTPPVVPSHPPHCSSDVAVLTHSNPAPTLHAVVLAGQSPLRLARAISIWRFDLAP